MRNFRGSFVHLFTFVNPFSLLLLMLMLLIAASAFAAPAETKASHGLAADPKGFDAKYPKKVGNGPLTAAQMADMGLRPVRLRHPWRGHNLHRNVEGGSWLLETLPAGTLVAVDANGNQVYKVDCANRLVWLDERPCPVCVSRPTAPAPRLIRRAWNGLWNFGKWLVSPITLGTRHYRHVTIDVAGPNGPYTIDSHGSHRVVITPRGDGRVTFDVQP